MLTKVNQLLKPEEKGWRWTGLYSRTTHQGIPSSKTKFFLRESSLKRNNLTKSRAHLTSSAPIL